MLPSPAARHGCPPGAGCLQSKRRRRPAAAAPAAQPLPPPWQLRMPGPPACSLPLLLPAPGSNAQRRCCSGDQPRLCGPAAAARPQSLWPQRAGQPCCGLPLPPRTWAAARLPAAEARGHAAAARRQAGSRACERVWGDDQYRGWLARAVCSLPCDTTSAPCSRISHKGCCPRGIVEELLKQAPRRRGSYSCRIRAVCSRWRRPPRPGQAAGRCGGYSRQERGCSRQSLRQ